MKTKSSSPLLIGMCSLLAVAGIVGPGAFRWVLLVIAGLIGLALAIRASRPTQGSAPAELHHAAYPKEISSSLQRLSELNLPDATVAPPLHRLLWRLGISVPPPVLASFSSNFGLFFVAFAAGWGVCMTALFALKADVAANALTLLGTTVSASFVFAAAMSIYFRSLATKHSLRA